MTLHVTRACKQFSSKYCRIGGELRFLTEVIIYLIEVHYSGFILPCYTYREKNKQINPELNH